MKIIKEYNMNVDSDRDDYKIESRAHYMHSALLEIQQLLRTKDKYSDETEVNISDLREEVSRIIYDNVLEEDLDV